MTKEQLALYDRVLKEGVGFNIKYASGTFDRNNKKRVFKSDKAEAVYRAINDKHTVFITLEGGQRGGKDVYALYSYANYLMYCPNKYHLVTGTTINQALGTVLDGDGFGLKYLLPHGKKCKKDNRIVFEFKDFFGDMKEVHFFGGKESGDKDAFQGFNYGSYYANEAILQHIETLKEGRNRTTASQWRKVIHTQNPLGGAFAYYTEYEAPLVAKYNELDEIYRQKESYELYYKKNLQEYNDKRYALTSKIEKIFTSAFGIDSASDLQTLSIDAYLKFLKEKRNRLLALEKEWNKENGKVYRDFDWDGNNPNKVPNGLYFKYFHFTNRDNLAMTDQDRKIIDDTSDKSSINYRRNVLGIRASSDSAIYSTFTIRNLYATPIEYNESLRRFIAIDYGVRNDFVILDCIIDIDNCIYVEREKRFDPKKEKIVPTNSFYADLVEDIIRGWGKGFYTCIIVDPSAKAFINELRLRHLLVKKADNTVLSKDKVKSDKKMDKSVMGIHLVREGFYKEKIMVNKKNCQEVINELEGYSFDDKKLAVGEEVPIKVADHGCDALRYVVNTIIKSQKRWSDDYEKTKTIHVE